MKIGIIGWYGTETLGDRAILLGIMSVLDRMGIEIELAIGSLYPFFTERTLREDASIYTRYTNIKKIDIYDVKNSLQKEKMIADCSIMIIGGGPLMEIRELDLFIYMMKKSKSYGHKTVVWGCGVGPISNKYFIRKVGRLFKLCDVVILRDSASRELIISLVGNLPHVYVMLDPAIMAVLEYKLEKQKQERKSRLVLNVRKQEHTFAHDSVFELQDFANAIETCVDQYDEILFVPMHTFQIGGDDRIYLNELAQMINNFKIAVCNSPINVYQLFDIFSEAEACVGMRYHSVVFQSILNGNNIILDYTNGKGGKIQGFIDMIDANDFYLGRICHLHSVEDKKKGRLELCLKKLKEKECFELPDMMLFERQMKEYQEVLQRLL